MQITKQIEADIIAGTYYSRPRPDSLYPPNGVCGETAK